jgi:hypothetical protein
MREGEWKLLRPPVKTTMTFPHQDGQADIDYAYYPERFEKTRPVPEIEREIPEYNKPFLFNVEKDPFEKKDLFEKYPDKVKNMEKQLDLWFEEVEKERRTITE